MSWLHWFTTTHTTLSVAEKNKVEENDNIRQITVVKKKFLTILILDYF